LGKITQEDDARGLGNVLSVGAIGESLPNPQSYVDLDPDQRDANGLPLARIHSFLPDLELRRLDFMAKKAREILTASARHRSSRSTAPTTCSAPRTYSGPAGWPDPTASVVDPYGRSHRWRNLFVTDASVFPSSGGGSRRR